MFELRMQAGALRLDPVLAHVPDLLLSSARLVCHSLAHAVPVIESQTYPLV